MRPDLRIAAQSCLAGFGAAEDVRRACTLARIQGVPGNCWTCLLAMYLRHRLGDAVESVLVGSEVTVCDRWGGEFALPLPPAVRESVRLFDAGAWPECVYRPEPGRAAGAPDGSGLSYQGT